MISYDAVFGAMGILALLMAPALLILKPPPAQPAAVPGVPVPVPAREVHAD